MANNTECNFLILKGLIVNFSKIAALFTFFMITTHSAFALDIQPGEWIMDSKGKPKSVCYTQKEVEQLKSAKPGSKMTVDGCSIEIKENTAERHIADTVCATPKAKVHVVIEQKKLSETEISMKMDINATGKDGRVVKNSTEFVQTFVGSKCSAASKRNAKK